MNFLKPANEPEMVTMFHLDGPVLMVTHYCSAGNQPRMVASSISHPKEIAFTFKDATNLASPTAGHMRGLVLTLVDADHHKQSWTFRSRFNPGASCEAEPGSGRRRAPGPGTETS